MHVAALQHTSSACWLGQNLKHWPVQGRGVSGASKAAESQVHDNAAIS